MKKRALSLFIAVTLMFLTSSWRIYDIVSDADLSAASSQMSYKLTVTSPRGNIYDRNLRKLVAQQSRYLAAVPSNLSTLNEIDSKLGDYAKVAREALKSGKPTVIEAVSDFAAEQSALFSIPIRYSDNQLASHVIGYTDGSGQGVTGIEYAFDKLLTCEEDVTVTYTVDANGRALSGVEPTVSGTTNIKTGVVLTLDSSIQRITEQSARSIEKGAVVVMNAKSGEILALASRPDYSPLNLADALKSDSSPLINRAFSAYNVGSVFKILVAAAAVDSGVSRSATYTCNGNVKIGTNTFNCHNLSGHGEVDMTAALANSCNPYFINLASKVGAKDIMSLCQKLRFNEKKSFADRLFAVSGRLPSEEKLSSQPAALANFSFGQGELLLTPIDVAVMTAMIANGGYRVSPRLVSGIMLADGSISEYMSESPQRVISEKAADTVAEMMTAVISSGTGSSAAPTYLSAGGKTATAEAGYKSNGQPVNQCWFSGFYPAENPEYVITVLAENGVSGSKSAAPVFRSICDGIYDLYYS